LKKGKSGGGSWRCKEKNKTNSGQKKQRRELKKRGGKRTKSRSNK